MLFLLTKRQPPSSRLRVLNCLPAYHEAGIETTVMPIPSDPIGRIGMLRAMTANDVVLIQKKTSFHPLELALMKRLNPRIIFDMDDAVMFHELEHRQPLTGKNFLKFIRTVNHCAAVVAGIRRGLLDNEVHVATRGGVLNIAWAGEGASVLMSGPAIMVFEGEINI